MLNCNEEKGSKETLLEAIREVEQRILNLYIFDEYEKIIIKNSIKSLMQKDNKLHYINFCTNIRQLITLYLDRVAPDEEIEQTGWFIPNSDPKATKDVSTRDKFMYSVFEDSPEEFREFVLKEFKIDYVTIFKDLGKQNRELNNFIHFSKDKIDRNFIDSFNEGLQVMERLFEFLNTLNNIKNKLNTSLENSSQDVIYKFLIENIPNEIDINATHSYFDHVDINNCEITLNLNDRIEIKVSGIIDYEHQLGSSRDLLNGDGVLFDDSYPFEASMFSLLENPLIIQKENSQWLYIGSGNNYADQI